MSFKNVIDAIRTVAREGHYHLRTEDVEITLMTTRKSAGWSTSWSRRESNITDGHVAIPVVGRGLYMSVDSDPTPWESASTE